MIKYTLKNDIYSLEMPTLILGTANIDRQDNDEGYFEILDKYIALGGSCIDTARVYCSWVEGGDGASEQVIGRWMDLMSLRPLPTTFRAMFTMSSSGRYCYSAPAEESKPRYDDRLRKIFRESVTSYAAAQNIVVIKTLPGLANGAAGTLDSMNVTDLVGTLAGDDTALLVMKTNAAAEALCEEIKKML